jgi:hypothetical protein
MPRSEVLRRLEVAINANADLGVTSGQLRSDFLAAVNKALRTIGGVAVRSLDDDGALYRAMVRLEAA